MYAFRTTSAKLLKEIILVLGFWLFLCARFVLFSSRGFMSWFVFVLGVWRALLCILAGLLAVVGFALSLQSTRAVSAPIE